MNRVCTLEAIITLCLLGTSGCAYKYTFRTGDPPVKDKSYTEWRHIGLWGWISPGAVNLEKASPEGVAELGSYVSFPNWICAFITVGLYSPRTAYVIPASGKGV